MAEKKARAVSPKTRAGSLKGKTTPSFLKDKEAESDKDEELSEVDTSIMDKMVEKFYQNMLEEAGKSNKISNTD